MVFEVLDDETQSQDEPCIPLVPTTSPQVFEQRSSDVAVEFVSRIKDGEAALGWVCAMHGGEKVAA
jgi:hypothetical protein